MSSDENDTPMGRALKRKKELQATIKTAMQELEKIDDYLRMHQRFSAEPGSDGQPIVANLQPLTMGRVGRGQAQPVFETMVRDVLQEHRRPMRSDEILTEFKRRGFHIGGNEVRTMWNRLWGATTRGTLVHMPAGYWLADAPVPDNPASRPFPRQSHTYNVRNKSGASHGKGRLKALSESQIKQAEDWILEGRKSFAEIARDLGGIAKSTLQQQYFPGGRRALREKYPERAAQLPRHPGARVGGGQKVMTPEKLKAAEQLYLEGKTFKEIGDAIDVRAYNLYYHFGRANADYWKKRRAEAMAKKGAPNNAAEELDKMIGNMNAAIKKNKEDES
jgi:hypothetical protein